MDETPLPPEASADPPVLICPECGGLIDVASISGAFAQCPHCRAQFFLPEPQAPVDLSEEEREAEETKLSQDQELSALKIKQRISLRRAAYRTRSYFIIATAGFFFIAMMLSISILKDLVDRHRWYWESWLYAIFIFASLNGAARFGRKWIVIQREIVAERRQRAQEELEAARFEPDLSTLSDGSQRARNLEQMTSEPTQTSTTIAVVDEEIY